MNKIIVIVTLVVSLGLKSTNSIAAPTPVGAGFNYQGELTDGGSPANGIYDFQIRIYSDPLTGASFLNSQDVFGITVTNGLFSLNNIDYGDATYNGDEIWLEIWVRQQGVGGLVKLDPRQRLHAVPYSVQAEFLAPNGANTNDVLQFDGGNWVASAVNVNSPWTDNGTSVSYLGRVGVGVTNNLFGFQVKGSGTQHPFEVTDASGVGIMRITDTGNIGIRTTTPQAQLHIFSPTGSAPLKVDVGTSSAISIDENARTKLGNDTEHLTFQAKLAINEADGAHPLSVKRNGLLELLVEKDGGVSIGSNFSGSFNPSIAPDKGLYVGGDIKTSSANNGLMKYMVAAFCGGAGTLIQRSYTAINLGGAISISNVGVGICDITFSTVVNDRFLLSSALNDTSTAKAVNCSYLSTNTVRCRRYGTSNSIASSGNISLFIY